LLTTSIKIPVSRRISLKINTVLILPVETYRYTNFRLLSSSTTATTLRDFVISKKSQTMSLSSIVHSVKTASTSLIPQGGLRRTTSATILRTSNTIPTTTAMTVPSGITSVVQRREMSLKKGYVRCEMCACACENN
jgi:hypothetical protein